MSKYAPKNPSADTIATVVTRYQAGESSVAIARDHGVSYQTIKNWVRKAGHPLRDRKAAAALRDNATNSRTAHRASIAEQRQCHICQLNYSPTSARQMYCRTCIPSKGWRNRYNRYGISKPMFDDMVRNQNHACALCLEKLDLENGTVIDHCHTTLRVRGLLCYACNFSIAMIEKNIDYHTRAWRYINP